METSVVEQLGKPLTRLERCDACGAAAYYRALNRAGVLLFCGHHGRAYSDSLVKQGWFLEDYTFLLGYNKGYKVA